MTFLSQYQIFKGQDDQWYWRLIAKNSETVCVSEGFKRRAGAIRAAKKMPELAQTTVISQLV